MFARIPALLPSSISRPHPVQNGDVEGILTTLNKTLGMVNMNKYLNPHHHHPHLGPLHQNRLHPSNPTISVVQEPLGVRVESPGIAFPLDLDLFVAIVDFEGPLNVYGKCVQSNCTAPGPLRPRVISSSVVRRRRHELKCCDAPAPLTIISMLPSQE